MGNIIGCLGEIVVSDYFLVKLEHQPDYDFFLNEKRIEVKTKSCSSEPKKNYLCSVAEVSLHQNCEYYVFVRVLSNLSKAYILGYISKNEFLKKGIKVKKGDIDVSSGKREWVFKADCVNIPISDLSPIEELQQITQK